MKISDIFWWAETQRVCITLLMSSGIQYEIDGRLFREGVFAVSFKDGKKASRKKIEDFHSLTNLKTENVKGIWIDFRNQFFWGYRSIKLPAFKVLERVVRNFPETTSKKKLLKYCML